MGVEADDVEAEDVEAEVVEFRMDMEAEAGCRD